MKFQNYLIQKERLKIPKFEYGLTNIFVYPNRIYDKYWEPFNNEIFKDVLKLGMDYLYLKIPEIEPIKILNNVINDNAFSTGLFNNELKTITNSKGKMAGIMLK